MSFFFVPAITFAIVQLFLLLKFYHVKFLRFVLIVLILLLLLFFIYLLIQEPDPMDAYRSPQPAISNQVVAQVAILGLIITTSLGYLAGWVFYLIYKFIQSRF